MVLNHKSYFFQHSKSSDSCCRGCNEIILVDEIRVYRNDHYEIYPYLTNGWFHLQCFWSLEEVKDLHANDIMLEIDYRERNYETEFWCYQKHKILKNNTQFSFHDGQNSCFYTSLAFYDSTNRNIVLVIDKEELMAIRKKLAEVVVVAAAVDKDSSNTLPSSTSSSTSGYLSGDDLASHDDKEQQLSNTTSSSDEDIQLSTTTTLSPSSSSTDEEISMTQEMESEDAYNYFKTKKNLLLD